MMRTLLQHLFSHVPPAQLFRYLIVGIWNTGFGYAMFALFTYLLSRQWPDYGYIPAGILANLVAISVAFLGYKWFVFRTKGNYLREWLRCVAVYGSSFLVGLVVMPCIVFLLHQFTSLGQKAPYLGAAILTGLNVIYNFLGHKKFSFRTELAEDTVL